jgi:signal transduction histidine kinase
VLCAQLADNLLSNAVRYHLPCGSIRVGLATRHDTVVLTAANTGPPGPG